MSLLFQPAALEYFGHFMFGRLIYRLTIKAQNTNETCLKSFTCQIWYIYATTV